MRLPVVSMKCCSARVTRPVLSDREEVAAGVLTQMVEPLREEPGSHVLDGGEPEPVDAGGLQVPLAPIEELLAHDGVVDVDVAAHQVVEVPLLAVDVLLERLALEKVDGVRFLLEGVLVDSVEVPPVPVKRGVLALAAREVEVGPSLDVL